MMPRFPAPLRLALAPVALLVLSGCALSGGTTPAPLPPGASQPNETASATPTASFTPTLMETPSPTPTTVPATPVTTPSGSPSPLIGTTGPIITVPLGTQRALSELDATSTGTWVRGAFQPSGSGLKVESLGQPVVCGTVPAPLVFTFDNTAGTLTLGAAQAADAPSSAETLTWTIVADGQLKETRQLGYRDATDLTVPLAGVSKLEVAVSNQGTCSGTAMGLIVKAIVNG